MIFTVKESSVTVLFSEREFNIVELKEGNQWSESLPNEAGQTVATIQFMAVAKVLNSIMTKHEIPPSITCKSLLITGHKKIMIFTLEQDIGKVSAVAPIHVKYSYM